MKKLITLFSSILAIAFSSCAQQSGNDIHLLVRGDDIGFSHGANLGCIESYKNGIVRSVEVMVPCAWFPEAVKLLNENPGLDVGVHLTLTSEWENIKWRPLTNATSLVDKDGYFFPMIWKNNEFPEGSFLKENNWKIEDVEKEFRAQIELAIKKIPAISHLSAHMGCTDLDPNVKELAQKLAKEYHLILETGNSNFKGMTGWGSSGTLDEKIGRFCEAVENLKPGNYLFVEHPANDSPEMSAIGMNNQYNTGIDREMVKKLFTSEKVKSVIQKKGIKLISYKDIK